MMIGFRQAKESDLDSIVRTYNATIPSRMVTADLEPVTTESRREWFRSHNEKRRPLWIVEKDGIYAGWISFKSFYGRPAYDGVAEVAVYLEPGMQGAGIGKKCLEKIIADAPGLGLHTLLGFIFAHNLPSLTMFVKMGFERWGCLPGVAEMDGTFRDLVILGLKLE